MKKTSKTLLALLLSLLMLLGTLPLTVFAANDTIQYDYNAETKTLTVTGTGAIDDYVGTNEVLNDGTPFDTAVLPAWYQACGHDAEAIVVGENITEIGDGAFLDFRNVTSVSLPSTLTRIGDCAFMYCESLSAIALPASLAEIGELAFVDTALTAIEIPAGVQTLCETFAYTGSLQQVTLHEGLKVLEGAFAFTSLQTLDIPSTVESFYDNYIFGLQTVINRSATAVVNGDCAMEYIDEIIRLLEEEYPAALCSLEYDSDWQLLFAVRLSAQCTDARVNLVTPPLFARFPSLEAFAEADVGEVEELIRSCGFFHTKARDLIGSAKMLLWSRRRSGLREKKIPLRVKFLDYQFVRMLTSR